MYDRLREAVERVWGGIYNGLGQELLCRPIKDNSPLLYFGDVKSFLESIKKEELRRAENSEICRVFNIKSLLELLEETSTTGNEKAILADYALGEIETYLKLKRIRYEN